MRSCGPAEKRQVIAYDFGEYVGTIAWLDAQAIVGLSCMSCLGPARHIDTAELTKHGLLEACVSCWRSVGKQPCRLNRQSSVPGHVEAPFPSPRMSHCTSGMRPIVGSGPGVSLRGQHTSPR